MSLLILSGYEPNAQAGLLTDYALATSLQQPVAAVVTCQTAQTEQALLRTQACDPDILAEQLASLVETPRVVKIGLIVTSDIAQVVADWLRTLPGKPAVVLDPVQSNSGDQRAFTAEPLLQRLAPLLPFIALITPNSDELQALTSSKDDQSAIRTLTTTSGFHGMVLLTGGHTEIRDRDTVIDRLYCANAHEAARLKQDRFAQSLRGSGCRLSTAIACALAQGYSMQDAVILGNATLHRYWRLYPKMAASVWPTALGDYPSVEATPEKSLPLLSFPKLHYPVGLYPVVDSAQWIKRLAHSGIRMIQLRIKYAEPDVLREEIKRAVELSKAHNLQLFINDHWQLAIEYGAFGIHLGQEDLEDADLEAIARAGLRLGISTHGDFELLRAKQLNPSYLAVGAIYPTTTKDMSSQIQGTDRLQRYVDLCRNTPIVAIGGIDSHNLHEVLDTGVPIVAVVRAVTQADNPASTAHTLHARIQAPNRPLRRTGRTVTA